VSTGRSQVAWAISWDNGRERGWRGRGGVTGGEERLHVYFISLSIVAKVFIVIVWTFFCVQDGRKITLSLI
jgi:hypothetical protein